MTVPEAMAHPALRRYPLRRLRLPMAGGNLSIVAPDAAAWRRRGGGVDRVLRGEEPPYWAEVWPASVALARLLCRGPSLCGLRALDLGCGLGVAGAAAARAGADVLLLDRDPDALAFAGFNCDRNARGGGRGRAAQFDWAAQAPEEGADLWLLADVTYRASHRAAILGLLRRGLGRSVVLHADPGRAESESFLRLCAAQFAMHSATTTAFLDGEVVPVRVALIAADAGLIRPWLHLLRGTEAARAVSGS